MPRPIRSRGSPRDLCSSAPCASHPLSDMVPHAAVEAHMVASMLCACGKGEKVGMGEGWAKG